MTDEAGREVDDEEEIPPPTVRRVAARAGVLISLAYRALIEEEDASEVREEHERLLEWVRAPDIANELEPEELATIESSLGGMPKRRVINDSWASEAAGVLAWALDLVDLPRYDEQVSGEDVSNAIDFLEDPWLLPESALLRAEEQVEAACMSALTLHWRLRQQVHHPGPMDLVDYVARCKWAPLTLDGLHVLNRDLVVRGRLVTEADPALVHECLEIAQERHTAFEWLVGGNASLWSEVTADT